MIIDIQRYWGDSEIFHPVELASKIIQSMQQHGTVTLFSKEGRSGRHSGLFQLLDELCQSWNWDPSNITLMTPNGWEHHDRYIVQNICHWYWMVDGSTTFQHWNDPPAWDGSKVYGMFLGRATAERIRGAVRHRNFEFKNLGLTSFHHDLQDHIDTPELLEYLCETNDRFSDILKIRPYSDIGKILKPPIVGSNDIDWKTVYKQIAVELVFETSTAEDCFTVSEKFMRPILYGRPFMLIAGRDSIKRCKDIDYTLETMKPLKEFVSVDLINQVCEKTSSFSYYENVFGLDYDRDAGVHRVDHVFDILDTLIRKGSANTILDECQQDLEHNRRLLLELQPLFKQITLQTTKYYDTSTWPK
jgi:hypothetical protein